MIQKSQMQLRMLGQENFNFKATPNKKIGEGFKKPYVQLPFLPTPKETNHLSIV
jgi:hypothetical protein